LGGLPASHRECSYTELERCHTLLEGGSRGVHNARIDIAESLQVEEVCGVFGVLEHVRGRLVDRYGACTGIGIWAMPGV
jgi:hypothetical protein